MKISKIILLFLAAGIHGLTYATVKPLPEGTDTIPSFLKGHFIDDYGIGYDINDTLWTQLPNAKYHIVSCDTTAQFLLVQNDANNPSEAGFYTRIDYMSFKDLMPFKWGFCLTVYNAKTLKDAEIKSKADRKNPKKGCNGFPFSRMKDRD